MTATTDLGFVHRFEPATAPGAPMLLLLHGTGGDESDLLPLGRMLHPGAALLAPRGRVLEQGMPRFFRRLAPGVFDQHDLTARTHELADFVGAAAAHYGVQTRPVVAVGFSNGANIAAALLLLRPRVLAGAILLRPMVPLTPPSRPALAGTRVFAAAGRFDPTVPAGEPERLAALLRSAGADVALQWSDAGHEMTHGDVTAARDWLGAA
jgi:predicted esterase